jgi:hypothetical protein
MTGQIIPIGLAGLRRGRENEKRLTNNFYKRRDENGRIARMPRVSDVRF